MTPLELRMRDPVLSSIYSQGGALRDAVLFNTIVCLEQNAHASLRQDRMRGLEIDMITRDAFT
jgi:hypothetical protein